LYRRRWQDCAQPLSDPEPWEKALNRLRDVFDRYPPGQAEVLAPAGMPLGANLSPALTEELSRDDRLAAKVEKVQRTRRAREIADEIEVLRNPKAPADAGMLGELLTRPVGTRWRVAGVLPASGRLLLSAQRKTGKTTAASNLARSLLTGEPFLGRFEVEKLTGRVVALNYEVTGEQYAAWMDQIGVPRDRLYVVNLRGRRNLLADEGGRGELVEMIRAQEGEVLIVDPFRARPHRQVAVRPGRGDTVAGAARRARRAGRRP